MSFICHKCTGPSTEGEPPNKVVVQTRIKTYVNDIKRKTKKPKIITVNSQGWEIVKEVWHCKKCYKEGDN